MTKKKPPGRHSNRPIGVPSVAHGVLTMRYGNLLVLHDPQDLEFFQQTKLFAYIWRHRRITIMAGKNLNAPRALVRPAQGVHIYYRHKPRRQGNTIVVDLRRRNLLAKPTQQPLPICDDRPHWIPGPDDKPSLSNHEYTVLFERWRQGDSSALDKILWATTPLIHGICSVCRPVSEQENLLSILSTALLRSASVWKPGGDRRAWITFCRLHLRQVANRFFKKLRDDQPLGPEGALLAEHTSANGDQYTSGLTPEALVVLPIEIHDNHQELKDLINRYLPRLSKDAAMVIKKSFLEGKTFNQIAEQDGRSRQLIGILSLKALARLRRMMKQDGVRLDDYIGA